VLNDTISRVCCQLRRVLWLQQVYVTVVLYNVGEFTHLWYALVSLTTVAIQSCLITDSLLC